MLVLEGLVGLQRTVQIQLLSFTGQGIDLDYCDTGWLALETDHSVIFETASKYCIQTLLLTMMATPSHTSPHGHRQMVNTKIRLIISFVAKDGEALYSQKNNTRS